jgi:hypothetical protein
VELVSPMLKSFNGKPQKLLLMKGADIQNSALSQQDL